MAKELLIVGAGSGGLILSNTVARKLTAEIRRGEINVTLLGDRDEYIYQPGFLYVIFDLMRPIDLVRKVRDLIAPGIRFVHDRAEQVDPANRTVRTQGGKRLTYDYLVLATGSDINPAEVPGLAEGGHWFYTLEGALRMREELHRFRGGKVVVSAGIPHKCPVAPLEFTFMFDDWCREKAIRNQTEITYTFPLNRAHTIQAVADWVAQEFERRRITLETFFNMETVDPVKREITSMEGVTLPYDLLVAVPPHVGDRLGADSGLTEEYGNWLPTDRNTLQLGKHANIFVLGDAAALAVPKAGSVAHFEAEVLGENLISLLTGSEPPRRYHGKTFCFIETGLEQATYLSFDYEHQPPMLPPSQAIHWFKTAYNQAHWVNIKGIV